MIFDEFAILCALHGNEGLGASEIAAMQGISCPTMTHRGNHLVELGLLERVPRTDDRRRMSCKLTPDGVAYVERHARLIVELSGTDSPVAGITPEELIPMVARMGSVPLAADAVVLLAFEAASIKVANIATVVNATGLLQPTVSMAVLRLENDGCIERSDAPEDLEGLSMRRSAACILTGKGERVAKRIASEIEAL